MQYKDRKGNIHEKSNNEDRFITYLYNTPLGNRLLKILTMPALSKAAGCFLSSPLSVYLIDSFIKKHGISLRDCVPMRYRSFNDFFTRKILKDRRPVDKTPEHLISPCDAKLTVLPISEDSVFTIKQVDYTLEALLRDEPAARNYVGGTALLFRLGVSDYHRYCYIDNARKGAEHILNGVLHTVNPIAASARPIYAENTRSWCYLDTENFGQVIQMEVGALLVGKIHNHCTSKKVLRGQEKGYFMFGGSSILVLFEKDTVLLDEDLVLNSSEGYETTVRYGEHIGFRKP